MGQITEFQYAETDRRKYIYINSALSYLTGFIIVSLLYTACSKYFSAFGPFSLISWTVMAGLFAGNLSGRLLFHLLKKSFILLVFIDLIFVSAASVFFLRTIIFTGLSFTDPLMHLYTIDRMLPLAVPLLLFFLIGMKSAYFMKVMTGEFIDNRQGIVILIFLSLIMSAAGLLYSLPLINEGVPQQYLAVSGFFILLSTIFIRLQFNPNSLYAKVFERDPGEDKEKPPAGERLYFSFLNIAFIIVYSFLSYILILRTIPGIYYYKLSLAAAFLILTAAGYLLAYRFRIKEHYVHNALLFPPLFIIFAFISYKAGEISPLFSLAVVPSLLLYGFSLNQYIRGIKHNYSHKKRYSVINFMILIMPFPIIAALTLISFTNSWFFISAYTVAAINLIIQSVNILGKKFRPLYKGLFVFFFLASIPALVIVHIILKMPMDNRPLSTEIKNFDLLKNINYNSPYHKERITITLYGQPVFILNDSLIRNMKRSMVPLRLYMTGGENQSTKRLIIDGNQKFFRNPVTGYFGNTECVDTIPATALAGSMLPFSGRQLYIAEESGIIDYLLTRPGPYQLIADNPDLYSQTRAPLRYTAEYLAFIKKYLEPEGVYTTSFNLANCRISYLKSAADSLKKSFKYHRVYLFTDILMIASSDSQESLTLTREKVQELSSFIKDNEEISALFFNEYHLLTKMIFRDIESFREHLASAQPLNDRVITQPDIYKPDEKMINHYLSENSVFAETISRSGNGIYYYNEVTRNIFYSKNILTTIKSFEKAESDSLYDYETARLFELKRFAEYNPDLSRYIRNILSYKEDYYSGAASSYEKNKNWEEAKKLYLAVLSINKNNFQANYRLGILYLILQDLEKSSEYLKNAMTIDGNNPAVFFQMGVLNFSGGKFNEAISFLNKAVEGKEHTAPLYKYLGLSHEKIGNTTEAETYFERSLQLDPNDTDTSARLNEIKKARTAEQRGWVQPDQKSDLDDEKGEKIEIPVNRSAYDLRLGEKGEETPPAVQR